MPSSHWYQLNEIMELIIFTQPKSILDIGMGFGKYGFLSREYLELFDGREKYNDWKRTIDSIEIFEKYLTSLNKMIYDKIYIGNALDILPTLDKKYDLILLVDILEHFHYDEGIQLLKVCDQQSNNTIISTPRHFFSQREMFGNLAEIHKFLYKKKHFKIIKNKIFIPNIFSLIVYIGDKSEELGKFLRKKRMRWKIASYLRSFKFSDWLLKKDIEKLFSNKSLDKDVSL
jgi:predicted SAM-dependent methyltransferase